MAIAANFRKFPQAMALQLVRDYQEEYIKKPEERKISKEKKVEYVKNSMVMYWSNTENRAWA